MAPPNPVREKRDLLQVLGHPSPTELLVRNGSTGEVLVSADDPAGILSTVSVHLQPSPGPGERVYDLLGFAPVEWWRASGTLITAVESGWLFVDLSANQQLQQPVQTEPSLFELFIARPPIETVGDTIVWDGSAWVVIPDGTPGQVLTSNAPDLPTWQSAPIFLPLAVGRSVDSSIYEVLGAFSLDASDYNSIRLIATASVTAGGLTGNVQLFNLTDATSASVLSFVGTTTTTQQTSALLVLPAGPKVYEVRARVTGGTPPSDRVLVMWAGLQLNQG